MVLGGRESSGDRRFTSPMVHAVNSVSIVWRRRGGAAIGPGQKKCEAGPD